MDTVKRKRELNALTESAILIAMAFILSFVKLFEFPWGGSITLVSMLPLVIISYRNGIKWGLISSLVFGILKIFLGFETISAAFLPGESQMIWFKALLMVLLDYVFAYTAVGISGVFKSRMKPQNALCTGAIVGLAARYVMHFLSGFILWGSYAEWFFTSLDESAGGTVGNGILSHLSGNALAAVYSLVYNGFYMIPELIITAIAAYLIGKIPAVSKTA